jgi:Rps23 Pro-64 3,4-dihydroxylase Tpa1-like proline 4-hydroxylase
MRANQILDGFSATLMQDERILSSSERELLASLLQNARAASGGKPEIQTAVITAIHRTVGETVAQRAFGLLGGSIVEQILAPTSSARTEGIFAHTQPPGPQPPSAPQPGNAPQPSVKRTPLTDQPMGPQPPSAPAPGAQGLQSFAADARRDPEHSRPDRSASVEVLEAPENVRAQCVVLDEFLAPHELDELMRFTLQRESDFQVSEVISPGGDTDVIDYNHRRSRVLMDLGKHHDVIVKRIRGVLPQVLERLGIEEFPVTWVETQITASNDGDFFHMHSDDGQDLIASRKLTFVYFFHSEPCQFKGGELRLHDANLKEERHLSAGSYQTIAPQQNQIVFFPCSLPHEITPVECPSQAFADSRFTVNGWLRN